MRDSKEYAAENRAPQKPPYRNPKLKKKIRKSVSSANGAKITAKAAKTAIAVRIVQVLEYLHHVLRVTGVREVVDQRLAAVCDDHHREGNRPEAMTSVERSGTRKPSSRNENREMAGSVASTKAMSTDVDDMNCRIRYDSDAV